MNKGDRVITHYGKTGYINSIVEIADTLIYFVVYDNPTYVKEGCYYEEEVGSDKAWYREQKLNKLLK